jgi:simple sugar transport system substrate-binding protein
LVAAGAVALSPALPAAATPSHPHVSIVVIGGASDDPFFSTVKNGVDAAASAVSPLGGKVTYLEMPNYDNIGPDAAKLAQTALSLHPNVIAVPDWVPSAEDAVLSRIHKAGITLIVYNSGTFSHVTALGSLTYIGTDYYQSGLAGGKEFVSAGAKNIVCVNTVPGDTSAEAMCSGYQNAEKAGGGSYSELELPTTSFGNPTAVAQAVKSELITHSSIDGVAVFGAQDADSAAAGIQQANDTQKVKLIGYNLSTNTLNRIKAGTQLATIDQQPYAQGFYTVMAGFQYVAYGINLASRPILTGPLVIDSKNVNQAIAGTALGVR